jgi:phage major head subunit gpT-like protein
MKPLTIETLEEIIGEIKGLIREDPIAIRPTMLLIQPALHKQAVRIFYWKPAIKTARGARGRKKAISWRTK